jgi:hypothetical protein
MSANNTDLAAGPATEAGWRPDPTGRYEWRYWDGGWTNRVASSSPVAVPADAAPSAAAPATTVAPAPAPAPTPLSAPPAFPSPGAPSAAVVAALPVPRPFEQPTTPGWDPTPSSPIAPAPDPADPRPRPGLWARITGFFTSFANEQESYHSEKVVEIDPDPRGGQMLASTPLNYGRAGLVALSACGVAIGSYLPWMSGTIDGIPFRISGFEDGHGWSFTIGALALVLAALLAVRWRVLRWVAIGLALALCGLTFRELVHTHDTVTMMNASAANEVDVGTGLWIMAGCAVVAMVASFRLGERD